ncbi:3636_t:CDS:2, partial [Acaulospora colombiana]
PTLVIDYDGEAHKFFKKWGNRILEEIKPKAVVVISAHWQTSGGINGETPIIYDFGGFSEELYRQKYHGKGSPKLAERIVNLLSPFQATINTRRGFDHGLWVPLKVAIPEPKDIPIIQVSLTSRASYEYHIKVGQALAPLRDEGVLLIGSGSLVHNLRDLFVGASETQFYTETFDKDAGEYVTKYSGKEREEKAIGLINHPLLRKAHPTDEHLVPLHVMVGASGNDQGKKIHEEFGSGISMSAIEFCGDVKF